MLVIRPAAPEARSAGKLLGNEQQGWERHWCLAMEHRALKLPGFALALMQPECALGQRESHAVMRAGENEGFRAVLLLVFKKPQAIQLKSNAAGTRNSPILR
jgi:hypothetical protein